MYSLENKIYNDSNSLPSNYLKDQANFCSEIRVCIAKGFMHLILMFLDEDIVKRMPHFDVQLDFTEYNINDFS